jgi:hypothetical protein
MPADRRRPDGDKVSREEGTSFNQYLRWLTKTHGFRDMLVEGNYYRSVTDRIKADLEASPFFQGLTKSLTEYNDEYYVSRGYALLTPYPMKLVVKPFESFILKTYRRNVLDNARWPQEPESGWIVPINWFTMINDIVRTILVVKYLDGVGLLAEKIDSLCKQYNCGCKVDFEAKAEGYYAAHLYVRHRFEVPSIRWDTEKMDVDIELQITTQLQDVIRSLLHTYYESRRTKPMEKRSTWQWDYRSDEFAANYLGHILHYVGGMIVDIRDKQQKEKGR